MIDDRYIPNDFHAMKRVSPLDSLFASHLIGKEAIQGMKELKTVEFD